MATTKKTAAEKAPKAAAKKTRATKAPSQRACATKKACEARAEKPAAKKAAPKKVSVEFVADCPLATTVSVAGAFNNWAVDADMLKKEKKTGLWKVKLSLLPGDYEYKFVCYGKNWDEGDNKIKHV